MNEALTYIYYIFDKFINFIFNEALLFNGVSIGWVVISIFIFSFVIQNILVVPSVKQKERTTGANTRKEQN